MHSFDVSMCACAHSSEPRRILKKPPSPKPLPHEFWISQ